MEIDLQCLPPRDPRVSRPRPTQDDIMFAVEEVRCANTYNFSLGS